MQDLSYKEFQQKLIPTVAPKRVLGVRIPQIRRYAKQLKKEGLAEEFLCALPHRYYDEDNLHGALLEGIRNFDKALMETERFLPYLDNWATCDSFCPKVLKILALIAVLFHSPITVMIPQHLCVCIWQDSSVLSLTM